MKSRLTFILAIVMCSLLASCGGGGGNSSSGGNEIIHNITVEKMAAEGIWDIKYKKLVIAGTTIPTTHEALLVMAPDGEFFIADPVLLDFTLRGKIKHKSPDSANTDLTGTVEVKADVGQYQEIFTGTVSGRVTGSSQMTLTLSLPESKIEITGTYDDEKYAKSYFPENIANHYYALNSDQYHRLSITEDGKFYISSNYAAPNYWSGTVEQLDKSKNLYKVTSGHHNGIMSERWKQEGYLFYLDDHLVFFPLIDNDSAGILWDRPQEIVFYSPYPTKSNLESTKMAFEGVWDVKNSFSDMMGEMTILPSGTVVLVTNCDATLGGLVATKDTNGKTLFSYRGETVFLQPGKEISACGALIHIDNPEFELDNTYSTITIKGVEKRLWVATLNTQKSNQPLNLNDYVGEYPFNDGHNAFISSINDNGKITLDTYESFGGDIGVSEFNPYGFTLANLKYTSYNEVIDNVLGIGLEYNNELLIFPYGHSTVYRLTR